MNKDLKKLRNGALKRLQELLAEIKIDPRGETVTGKVAFMPNISGALVQTDEGIYMIGPRQRPQADPDLSDEPYLHYFVEALVTLGQMSEDKASVALATLQRRRSARYASEARADLKAQAETFGFKLVKTKG